MGERRICSDCHKESPETDTAYTLIDAHGWRNTRQRDAEGRHVVEWRCAECWLAHKEQTGRLSATMPLASSPAPPREDVDPSAPFVHAAQRLQQPGESGGGKRS